MVSRVARNPFELGSGRIVRTLSHQTIHRIRNELFDGHRCGGDYPRIRAGLWCAAALPCFGGLALARGRKERGLAKTLPLPETGKTPRLEAACCRVARVAHLAGWPWGSLGVALGSHWGGFGVPMRWLSTRFGVALMWLWVAGPVARLISAFCFHLLVALPGLSRFKVRGSKFGLQHQQPEYNSPSAPPPGWSGGTLDKPWTSPGTVDPAQAPIFDQPLIQVAPSAATSAAFFPLQAIHRALQSAAALPQHMRADRGRKGDTFLAEFPRFTTARQSRSRSQISFNAETQRARRNAKEKSFFFLLSLRPSALSASLR